MVIKIYSKLTFFLVFLTSASGLSHAAESQKESHWVVAAVDGGAWKSTQHDPSVRTTVRAGDEIRPTDRLETFQNNQVALARDRRGQNIVAVRGAFEIERSKNGSQVRLQRGRALAVLDGLKGSEDFNVATLAGVASVRGTRFSVETAPKGMSVKTFRGEVRASAYAHPNTASKIIGRSVSVEKGEKTAFENGSKEKLEAVQLSPTDWAEYENQLQIIRSARQSLKESGDGWFDAASQPSRSRRVPGSGLDSGDIRKDAQAIVF